MSRQSPLRDRLHELGAMLDPYGEGGPDLCQALAPIELEYAAIRTGCAVFDEANRSYIEVRGEDRLEFLNRMLTQELKGIEPGEIRESFWLNRKGRIDADMRVIELADRTLLEVDSLVAERAIETLSDYLFAEDTAFEHTGERLCKLSFHGPNAPPALAELVKIPEDDLRSLSDRRVLETEYGGEHILLLGDSLTGEIAIACAASSRVIQGLFDRAIELEIAQRFVRPIGWQALNIARIESGLARFLLDFGPRSLPAESGLIDERVSFTKGCYLGQEIVARMHSLGHPKQTLVGLRLAGSGDDVDLPDTGASVRASNADKDIGAITSATLSPMLGRAPVAFAMVRWGRHESGTRLRVQGDEGWLDSTVQPTLRFWTP